MSIDYSQKPILGPYCIYIFKYLIKISIKNRWPPISGTGSMLPGSQRQKPPLIQPPNESLMRCWALLRWSREQNTELPLGLWEKVRRIPLPQPPQICQGSIPVRHKFWTARRHSIGSGLINCKRVYSQQLLEQDCCVARTHLRSKQPALHIAQHLKHRNTRTSYKIILTILSWWLGRPETMHKRYSLT